MAAEEGVEKREDRGRKKCCRNPIADWGIAGPPKDRSSGESSKANESKLFSSRKRQGRKWQEQKGGKRRLSKLLLIDFGANFRTVDGDLNFARDVCGAGIAVIEQDLSASALGRDQVRIRKNGPVAIKVSPAEAK